MNKTNYERHIAIVISDGLGHMHNITKQHNQLYWHF